MTEAIISAQKMTGSSMPGGGRALKPAIICVFKGFRDFMAPKLISSNISGLNLINLIDKQVVILDRVQAYNFR
jgi:hypothetical protein